MYRITDKHHTDATSNAAWVKGGGDDPGSAQRNGIAASGH